MIMEAFFIIEQAFYYRAGFFTIRQALKSKSFNRTVTASALFKPANYPVLNFSSRMQCYRHAGTLAPLAQRAQSVNHFMHLF